MTQPPPDRAPEEQVSAAFVLPLRAFQPDVDSGFWYVHDANGMEVATCYCDSSGARARAIVAAVNGAAALRARGVADEAARKVADLYVEEQQLGYSHKFTDPCACARCRLRWAVQGYQFALAATRAGNETNKAGEGDAVAQTSGGVPFDSARPSPAASHGCGQPSCHGGIFCEADRAPSPATSTAEATAEESRKWFICAPGGAWWCAPCQGTTLDLARAHRYTLSEAIEITRWASVALMPETAAAVTDAMRAESMAESARLRAELAQAVAAKERALAEREQIRRCLFQMQEAAKDLAQPARQPAASGDVVNHPPHYTRGGIEAIDVIEAWHLDFCTGNALKYLARAGHKGDAAEDLKKARWYIDRALAARAAAGDAG